MCACDEPSTDYDFTLCRQLVCVRFCIAICDVKLFSLCFFMEFYMDILSRLSSETEWEAYYNHKVCQGNLFDKDAKDLCGFIADKEYLRIAEKIQNGETFLPPRKKLISKSKVGKKRVVYTYGREENYVLKLIAFLLRDYDHVFAPNLYSFRKNRGVKLATSEILKIKNLNDYYVYKVDISDYFNSVDICILMPELRTVLSDNLALYEFLRGLLECPYAEFEGTLIKEQKGIMAGVPISGFLANLYLRDMDFLFYENAIPYMRYSDDIIAFAKTGEELQEHINLIGDTLAKRGLKVNEEKELVTEPKQQWTFLGFSYDNGTIDICPVSFEKLKAKMRRKTRALARWASKKGVHGERAARAFVKRFNAKLYDNPVYNELTWTRWFFPVINTDRTLKHIDAYMQDCIRYLATGKRTKAKYNFKYEDIKALGYRSLVNEYYKQKSEM